MRTEEQCKPSERFLFADTYLSDSAIEILQTECVKRCRDKEKGVAYKKYINWTRQEDEIAVFTLYAYADIGIPKRFDTIFHLDNPNDFLLTDYELTQSILEAWFPIDTINHGYKHICILSFDKEKPSIMKTLYKMERTLSTSPKGSKSLGFCNFNDFDDISKRVQKRLDLKRLYGDKWWEHDD